MSIKAYRPTTPAQRQKTTQDFDQITTRKPLKSLLKAKKQNAGKNSQGRITVRHRGGGVKRHYRLVTHNLPKNMTFEIMEIEYDPNRSARIARVKDTNNTFYYVIADSKMFKGKTFQTGAEAPIEESNRLPLSNIPVGTMVYSIVRGVVMNATDHPHGGGDGGRHGTGKAPRTPWGQLTLGFRTRHNKKTNKMIVRSRHEGKRK